MKKLRDKTVTPEYQDKLQFSQHLYQHKCPPVFKLQFSDHHGNEERIVIPRNRPSLPPNINAKNVIQSMNVSRHLI